MDISYLRSDNPRAITREFVDAYRLHKDEQAKALTRQHPLDGVLVDEWHRALEALGITSASDLQKALDLTPPKGGKGSVHGTAQSAWSNPADLTGANYARLQELRQQKCSTAQQLAQQRHEAWHKHLHDEHRPMPAEDFQDWYDRECLAKAQDDILKRKTYIFEASVTETRYREALQLETECRVCSDIFSLLDRPERHAIFAMLRALVAEEKEHCENLLEQSKMFDEEDDIPEDAYTPQEEHIKELDRLRRAADLLAEGALSKSSDPERNLVVQIGDTSMYLEDTETPAQFAEHVLDEYTAGQ